MNVDEHYMSLQNAWLYTIKQIKINTEDSIDQKVIVLIDAMKHHSGLWYRTDLIGQT